MAALPVFRNRRYPSRSDYSLLDNTDSDAESVRRRSISSQVTNHSVTSVLCEKCWVKHERNRATKRCTDCKENLCTVCAQHEHKKSSWWLPGWLVQCWRFIFTKTKTSHTIVDIDTTEYDNTHWAHTTDASHVQHIPRVSRSSLRSNESQTSRQTDISSRSKAGRKSESLSKLDRKEIPINNPKRLGHSQSFDAKAKKRQHSGQRPRRTKSSEEIVSRNRRDDLERLKRYNQNWEDFERSCTEPKRRPRKQCNKMAGKDINIEITESKGIKLTVNSEEDRTSRNINKCAVSKSKSKRKSKDEAPHPYTEEIFEEVPIWFKKSSKYPSKERQSNKRNSKEMTPEINKPSFQNIHATKSPGFRENSWEQKHFANQHQGDGKWRASDTNSDFDIKRPVFRAHGNVDSNVKDSGQQNAAYIVEEPPDTCPICLEDLPGGEARTLACYHVIHTKCLIVYLHKMDLDFGIRCPLCTQTTYISNYYEPKERWYTELPVSTSV